MDEESSTEVVATIAVGYVEGIARSAWKAQLRIAQQVLTMEQGPCIIVPTMVFGGKDVHDSHPPITTTWSLR